MNREPVVIRGSHVSSLHGLAAELNELHREMLRTGRDEVRPVRLSVLTLVVACNDEQSADEASDVIRHLASDHPARAILVVADRNASPPGVDADLALECSAIGGADQICAETVRLAVRGEPALHLVSVVTPLLLPDVPVHLWLCGAPPLEQALHGEVLAVCERVLLDSDAYPDPLDTLRALDRAGQEHGHLPIGDLAWARLLHWRELLAQGFDGAEMRPFLHGVEHVEIVSCGERPSGGAWLLAGWLSARLRWQTEAHGTAPRIELPARSDTGTEAGGLLGVHLHCSNDGRSADVSIDCNSGMTVTRIRTDTGLDATRTTSTPPPQVRDLVGRELQDTGEDRAYVDALHHAAALADTVAAHA